MRCPPWFAAYLNRLSRGCTTGTVECHGEGANSMFKRAVLPACFATTLLLASGLAEAGPNDILIGLDEKITYGPDGPINGSPGKDEVLVMDVTSPAKPVIRA